METAAAWKHQELELVTTTSADGVEIREPGNGNTRLRALALQLLDEVQSMEDGMPMDAEAPVRNLDGGLDFYDEVRRFEIDLIKRALRQTGGHQGRAARLLTLKVSTLNAKIKHYDLHAGDFSNSPALVRITESDTRQAV